MGRVRRVIVIVGIAVGVVLTAALMIPTEWHHPVDRRTREILLRQDLLTFRQCIAPYHVDKGRYPPSIKTLAMEKYFRKVPPNPFTGTASWRSVRDVDGAVVDVRSAYDARALDGSRYRSW
jgi:general secretion pathway protein G